MNFFTQSMVIVFLVLFGFYISNAVDHISRMADASQSIASQLAGINTQLQQS